MRRCGVRTESPSIEDRSARSSAGEIETPTDLVATVHPVRDGVDRRTMVISSRPEGPPGARTVGPHCPHLRARVSGAVGRVKARGRARSFAGAGRATGPDRDSKARTVRLDLGHSGNAGKIGNRDRKVDPPWARVDGLSTHPNGIRKTGLVRDGAAPTRRTGIERTEKRGPDETSPS
jgi:hypothetical protein